MKKVFEQPREFKLTERLLNGEITKILRPIKTIGNKHYFKDNSKPIFNARDFIYLKETYKELGISYEEFLNIYPEFINAPHNIDKLLYEKAEYIVETEYLKTKFQITKIEILKYGNLKSPDFLSLGIKEFNNKYGFPTIDIMGNWGVNYNYNSSREAFNRMSCYLTLKSISVHDTVVLYTLKKQ